MVTVDNRIPQRGDIFSLSLNSRVSREKSEHQTVIVISPVVYNQISKIILICPIANCQKKWPFEVELSDEMQTYGFVLADQIKAVDISVRSATFIESASSEVINEVLEKIATLVTDYSAVKRRSNL